MQFSMDQDIPGDVARSRENPGVTWETYDISFHDLSLYIPPRYYKSGLKEPCHNWLGSRAAEGPEEENEDSFPPGFPMVPLCRNVGESKVEDDNDHVPLSQLRSKPRKRDAGRSRAGDSGGNLSESDKWEATSQNPYPRDAAAGFELVLDEEPEGESMPSDPTTKARVIENDDTPAVDPVREQEIPGRTAWRIRGTFEVDMLELELLARISELQRNVATMKAQTNALVGGIVKRRRADKLEFFRHEILVG